MDNFISRVWSEYPHRMRWDDVWGGLDSLWDAEHDNAEWDERREIARAERAQYSFVEVLLSSARGSAISAGLAGVGQAVHLTVVGANWAEGTPCGSHRTIIVPLHSMEWVSTAANCDCTQVIPRVVEHITLTARLRSFERAGSELAVSIATGGFRGRVSAVWRDGFELHTAIHTVSVALNSIHCISVERS